MYISMPFTKSFFRNYKFIKINTSLLLAMLAGSFICAPLYAQEITISDDLESRLRTSTANNGSAANITVDSDGTVFVSSGVAVTIDSNNFLTVDGAIGSTSFNNGVGVHFDTQLGQNLISTLSLDGTIDVSETDEDGNVGSNNYGVLIDGEGVFQGNILGISPSAISVYGNNSAGFSLQTDMIGSVNLYTIAVAGNSSNGVEILGDLSGNLNFGSTISASNANNHGVYVGGNITGRIDNLGYISTGTGITYDDDSNEIAAVAGIASLRISGDVDGGFLNNILFTDSDGDVINIDESDTTTSFTSNTSTITATGGGYALLITPEKLNDSNWADITLGGTNSYYGDYSLMNQGSIAADGINSGQKATAVYVTGATKNNINYNTTFENGFYNGRWGSIAASSVDASATAVHIGSYATVPEFINNGSFSASSAVTTDDDGEVTGAGGNSYGIIIDNNATLTRFENNNSFLVSSAGYNTSAYGILDNSGTLDEFHNTGTFTSSIWDDSTGSAIAVDFSKNTTGISFLNKGQISGDVYLGSGTNEITLEGLTVSQEEAIIIAYEDEGYDEDVYGGVIKRDINGTIYLKGGSTTLNMSDNSKLLGGIYSPNSQLEINLKDRSELTVLSDIPLNANNILVEDQSSIIINIDGQGEYGGGINAQGSVVFSDESQLRVKIQSLIDNQGSYQVIKANSLSINDEGSILSSGNELFIYDVTAEIDDTSLRVGLRRKSSEELGLSYNLGQIYDASISALLEDAELASVVSSAENKEDFSRIYNEMMPNVFSQASRQMIINSNNLSLGAVSSQLDNLRNLQNKSSQLSVGNGMWGQQHVNFYSQKNDVNETGGNGYTVGIAAGYEFVISKKGTLGVSLTQNISSLTFNGQGKDHIGMANTQFGVYNAFWLSDLFFESHASIGLLSFESERDVVYDDFSRTALGEWGGLQYSGNFKTGYEFKMGPVSLTPTAGINYSNLRQNSYTETEGGTAVNLNISEFKTSSLTGNLNLELAYKTNFNSFTLQTGLQGGWSHEFYTNPIAISARFAGFEDEFSLIGGSVVQNNYQIGSAIHLITDITAFSFKYDAEWREGYLGHSGSVNFRVQF